MDVVYNVNSYHVSGIPRLIRFLKTKPNLSYIDYATIVSRFYNEVCNSNIRVNLNKIILIQECMFLVSRLFKGKIYGYDKFLKFMSKAHASRMNRVNNTLRSWIINTTENPNHPIGKRRKLDEYNELFS